MRIDISKSLVIPFASVGLIIAPGAVATAHSAGQDLRPAGQERCAAGYTAAQVTGLGGTATHVNDINARGQVGGTSRTGSSFRPQLPFTEHQGRTQRLEVLPGATFARVLGVDDGGTAAGEAFTASPETSRPVVWDKRGRLTVLASPGRPGGVANDISNRGDVVGVTTSTEGRGQATVWDKKGRPQVLPSLVDVDGASARANAVDNDGTIVGQASAADGEAHGDHAHLHTHAVLWERSGVVRDLGALEDHGTSRADAVAGPYVVGEASQGSTWQAVTFDEQGPVVLPALSAWTYHTAKDVNRSGVAVGNGSRYYGNTGFGGAGVVWCEGRAVDLNSTVKDSRGVTIRSANAINAAGQIAATGIDAEKRTVSLVLTPTN